MNVSRENLSSRFGYTVIVLGVMLSFVAAVVPYSSGAHRLLFGIFIAGIVPYLAYGIVVALLKHSVTTGAGALLLLAHGGLVISERFFDNADYSDGSLYYMPFVLTGFLVPLVIRALREPWHG